MEELKSILLNTNKDLRYYLHPLELRLRDRYIEIVSQHGNGLWALDTLSWEVYINNIDAYEQLNEDDKFIVNMYMKALRCLYK